MAPTYELGFDFPGRLGSKVAGGCRRAAPGDFAPPPKVPMLLALFAHGAPWDQSGPDPEAKRSPGHKRSLRGKMTELGKLAAGEVFGALHATEKAKGTQVLTVLGPCRFMRQLTLCSTPLEH
jgi:hypothetical protein